MVPSTDSFDGCLLTVGRAAPARQVRYTSLPLRRQGASTGHALVVFLWRAGTSRPTGLYLLTCKIWRVGTPRPTDSRGSRDDCPTDQTTGRQPAVNNTNSNQTIVTK